MTAQDWIKQRREREQAATPGPWEADLDKHGETRGIWPTTPDEEIVIGSYVAADGYDSVGWAGGTDENLRFIADARTALPKALTALEKVLEIHTPYPLTGYWDECTIGDCGHGGQCEEETRNVCQGCSPDLAEPSGPEPTWPQLWPCRAVQAITSALESEAS